MIRFFAQPDKPERVELYNLVADIGETNNVAASHPEVVERLLQNMKEAHRINRQFLLPLDPGFTPASRRESKNTGQIIQ